MTTTPPAGQVTAEAVGDGGDGPLDEARSASPLRQPGIGSDVGRWAGEGNRRRSLARTVCFYALTLVVLVTLNFLLPRAMPGDPITAMLASSEAGGGADADTRAALESYYGLDQPLPVQYGRYLSALVQGDLGVSMTYRAPVTDVVGARLPWTLLLAGTAVALATLAGLVAGVHSGWRRGRWADRGLLTVFVGVRNIPPYFLATVALFVFAVELGWVPLGGAVTPFTGGQGMVAGAVDIAHHLVAPAAVLAVQFAAGQYLVMRAGMVGQLGAGYLAWGRARGLSPRRLQYRYAARNALLPVVSLTALQLNVAVSAGIFVETVFAYPGIGRLIFEAVGSHDYPVLQACFLVLTVVVLAANFLADALYARLDPRVAG